MVEVDRNSVKVPSFVSFTKTWHNKPYDDISPTRPELSAAGKNVVVTGGGTGAGKAIATAFAQAGAKSVSILGRRPDRLQTAAADIAKAVTGHTEVLYEVADLRDRAQVEKALRSISDKVGRLDILVSNAGTLPDPAPVTSYDDEALLRAFRLNTISALHAVQAFVPLAVAQPTVFNISSGIAHFAPMPGMGVYALTKAATLKLFDYFGGENPDMHVVSIQPGVMDTEMNEGTSVKGEDAVELPGAFCVWLASPEARFLRGKYVWANWDVKELLERKDEIKDTMLLNWIIDGVPM